MARRYGAAIETPHGPRKCMQVTVERGEGRRPLVVTFGGIPLRRQRNAVLIDREPAWDTARGSELIRRLLRGRCELCGQTAMVQVHQIRKLADLDNPGQPEQPEWMRIMAKRRRKTLVVCQACHDNIHLNKPTAIAA
jgi:AI2M/AI1M-like, HNH endonuclease